MSTIKANQNLEGTWPLPAEGGKRTTMFYRFRGGSIQEVPDDLASHLCDKLKYATPHTPGPKDVVNRDHLLTTDEAPDQVRTEADVAARKAAREKAIAEGKERMEL